MTLTICRKMASDSEDLEDLEALRQAALATVKARTKDVPACDESIASKVSFGNEDGDDDLIALREAALKSKGRTATVDQADKAKDIFLKQKHSKKNPQHKLNPYTSQRNGSWRKTASERRQRHLIVIPLESSRAGSLGTEDSASSLKVVVPPDNLASEPCDSKSTKEQSDCTTESTTDESCLVKKRKVGKFSRYDADEDSESDESVLDSSDLSSPTVTHAANNNSKLESDSDSDCCLSLTLDTRIVTQERPLEKDENSDTERTVDSILFEDKLSDCLLQEYDEPLLDIEENGDIDDAIEGKSPENLTPEIPCSELLDVEPLDAEPLDLEPLDGGHSTGLEVFEARKRKFDSTKEISHSELKKTISLKGIVPKSRKHRKHHRTSDALHSSSEKESILHSRDLRERNYDEADTSKPLSFVSQHRRERGHRRVHKRSRSRSESKYGGGSLSDDVSQSLQKREKVSVRQRRSGSSSSSKRFVYPVSNNEGKQRKVIQKEDGSSWACRKIITSKYLSDQSDSEECNENTFLKKHCQSNSRKFDLLDSVSSVKQEHKPKSVLAHNRIQSKHSTVRGWISLMEDRSKRKRITKDTSRQLQQTSEDQTYLERPPKSPVVNITFNSGSHTFQQKDSVEDRLSAHQRLGVVSKSKQESFEKSKDKHHSKKESKKTKIDCSKESELDRKIQRIQEMNAAILKRQQEVLKDKEQYG
ncbi:uncharacterized protein LOC106868719 isoform X1 [Octopus bimaculoides]|nr:uncharacterized protein LOC106868719 isoform X1 [Octopus bimaculoides]|eukprot:XP_014769596.1 PREDICTED: uncharacterized protein LOC106868719 isoform X1 [Octopus bimaculoides]